MASKNYEEEYLLKISQIADEFFRIYEKIKLEITEEKVEELYLDIAKVNEEENAICQQIIPKYEPEILAKVLDHKTDKQERTQILSQFSARFTDEKQKKFIDWSVDLNERSEKIIQKAKNFGQELCFLLYDLNQLEKKIKNTQASLAVIHSQKKLSEEKYLQLNDHLNYPLHNLYLPADMINFVDRALCKVIDS